MARIHHRKARKDYPNNGVKKGDMYYFVQIKTGPRSSRIIRSLTRPKPSQLTSSEYLSTLYGIQEGLGTEVTFPPEDMREIASSLEELGTTQRDNFEAMPEGLQQGDTGTMLEERASACENAAGELEGFADEMDGLEEPTELDYEDDEAVADYEDDQIVFDDEVERIAGEARSVVEDLS